jgi:hypothetical protein
MNNVQSIINGFNLQDKLNPNIWSLKNGKYTMKPNIRRNLLEIAYDFIDSLNVDVVFSDVVMTGSLANFNWSKYSDVDIHIIVDYNQFPKNTRELYDELFRMKKTIYSTKHDIKIHGYDVELYVEDEKESRDTKNVGRFSILNNEWLVYPSKSNVKIDIKNIKETANQWMKIIDGVLDNIEDEDINTSKKIIDKYINKLRKFRQCGLDKGGEYSEENLVFKILRRNGYLEKLKDSKNKLVDKRLTIKEAPESVNPSKYTNMNFKPYVVGNSNPLSDKINPLLLNDIDLAAKNANVKVSITTAVSGHRKGSRHSSGHAVDIAMVNGLGFRNETDANKKGILDDIRKFVDELIKLGYKKNTESGNDKAVLTFGFKGHDHHIHVSRKSDSGEITTDSLTQTTNSQNPTNIISKEDLINMFKGAFGQFIKPQKIS